MAATAELSRFVIGNVADNKAIIEEWIAHWTPEALAAAQSLRPLAIFPQNPDSFDRALEQCQVEQRALLASAGLGAKREVA